MRLNSLTSTAIQRNRSTLSGEREGKEAAPALMCLSDRAALHPRAIAGWPVLCCCRIWKIAYGT